MAIEFYCPGCGTLMRTSDETAGRKGRCPHCQVKVRIPDQSLAALPPPATSSPGSSDVTSQARQRWKIKESPARPLADPPTKTISFMCSHCQRLVKVAAEAAGKQGRCPGCGGVVPIPS